MPRRRVFLRGQASRFPPNLQHSRTSARRATLIGTWFLGHKTALLIPAFFFKFSKVTVQRAQELEAGLPAPTAAELLFAGHCHCFFLAQKGATPSKV